MINFDCLASQPTQQRQSGNTHCGNQTPPTINLWKSVEVQLGRLWSCFKGEAQFGLLLCTQGNTNTPLPAKHTYSHPNTPTKMEAR